MCVKRKCKNFDCFTHVCIIFASFSSGMCYTQALGMMSQAEDSKHLPMDIDSLSHPPPLESYADTASGSTAPSDVSLLNQAGESNHRPPQPPLEMYSPNDVLKHEHHDANSNSTVASINEHSDFGGAAPTNNATTPVSTTNISSPAKVTSQLREMLQNPGLPTKDNMRHHQPSTISSSVTGPPPPNFHGVISGMPAPVHNSNNQQIQQQQQQQQQTMQLCPHQNHNQPQMSPLQQTASSASKSEQEVYKFKNNIKHRFNADLRHHTASPTDSHNSDHVSLPDEDRTSDAPRNPTIASSNAPSTTNGHHHAEDGLSSNVQPAIHPRAFTEYHPPPTHSELSVKIPDRNVEDAGNSHWDSHVETGSSCGSNPSTPPAARSNGSSSGYSTSGEMPPVSKFRPPGHHSPATSPYSRSPDHVSNRSPSPPPGNPVSGVPIFALHPKGTFYIPLTMDANFLAPYLLGTDELSPVLHPVSICVNFSFCHSVKVEKMAGSHPSPCHYRSHTYLMDRYNDRYVYGDTRPRL